MNVLKHKLGRHSAPRPPGPAALPFLGPIGEVRRDPLGFMVRTARAHGDVAYTRFAGMPTYLLSHPDAIEHVLLTGRANYPKSDLAIRFRPLLGEGLLTSGGALWTRQRKLMSPAFQHKRVLAYADAMSRATEEHLHRWVSGEVRSVNEDMMHLTLDIAVRTLFGSSSSAHEARVSRALHDVSDYFARTLSQPFPWPLSVPTPLNFAFLAARAELDEVVHGIIREKRQSQERSDDLLTTMLELTDEHGQGMSDQQLRDEVLTLLLAGHETTALTLTYALYLLAQHPEVADWVAAELSAVLGDRPPTLADLPALVRTEQLVKEAMRLYPPAAVLTRKAREDDVVMGWTIPAGSMVVLPQWVTHRDPRYFDDPERFWPERWTEALEAKLPRFAYFPFGGGGRVCIGSAFATLEARLALAELVRRFRYRNVDTRPLELIASITVRPKHAVRLEITERRRAASP
jgi:cytochrome P450